MLQAALNIIVYLAQALAEYIPELIPTIVDVILEIVDVLTAPDTLADSVLPFNAPVKPSPISSTPGTMAFIISAPISLKPVETGSSAPPSFAVASVNSDCASLASIIAPLVSR